MATRIYKTSFAATGDKEALATADQPDGKVSLQAGWTPDYELPNDNANYRPVGRAEMNGILSEVTEGLGEMQLNGFAKWQAIDGGWPLGAQVSHGGTVYKSTVADNVAEPGPGVAGWKNANAGALLRTTVYRIISGTQQVSIDGGAFTSVGATVFTSLPVATKVEVRLVGGGGGGGGTEANGPAARSSGAGGGAGGEVRSIVAATLTAIPITVGAGGFASTGSGGTGGTSSFGAVAAASGGDGGARGLTTTGFPLLTYGGGGGVGALGNILNARGESGSPGFTLAANHGVSGAGGSSSLGGGGSFVAANPGLNAETPGAGGSGAAAAPNTGPFAGGAGAPGLVTIREYS